MLTELLGSRNILLLTLIVQFLFGSSTQMFGQDSPPVKMGAWQYLFGGKVRSLQKSPMEQLSEFELTGADQKHPFKLNEVVADGQWGMVNGVVQQTSGRSAMLKLGRAEDFELEVGLNAEGLGGWFLVFGFDEGHGYGFYNFSMKESGSPWHLSEFRAHAGIESTDREFARYDCRGMEPLIVSVKDRQLSVKINRRTLIKDELLADYGEGDIILGTYDTKYGPKPLKLYGLRMRTPQDAQ